MTDGCPARCAQQAAQSTAERLRSSFFDQLHNTACFGAAVQLSVVPRGYPRRATQGELFLSGNQRSSSDPRPISIGRASFWDPFRLLGQRPLGPPRYFSTVTGTVDHRATATRFWSLADNLVFTLDQAVIFSSRATAAVFANPGFRTILVYSFCSPCQWRYISAASSSGA